MSETPPPPPDEQSLAERLAAERQRTTARIAALTRDFQDIVENAEASNLDDEHDPEGATIGFERSQVTALLSQARARLDELEWAQEQLRQGRYGRCERCGQPIGTERLAALPTATLCLACAAASSRRR